LNRRGLTTVCQQAHCPNQGRCWHQGHATFMILGDRCTRACRFCAVATGLPQDVDAREADEVARAVAELNLAYVVITSVTRDDLPDGGAGQFVKTIQAVRHFSPMTKIEVLIPDFGLQRSSLESVVEAHPDVIAHNMETVARLYPRVRPQAGYRRSLDVLKTVGEMDKAIFLKSGFMVGLGEMDDEIRDLTADVAATGCRLLTIGQYLSPSRGGRHVPVERFVVPQQFADYQQQALDMGFGHVFSGPLVRSSYLAEDGYRHLAGHSEENYGALTGEIVS